ncbi:MULTISPECIES: hypothetical protein [Halorhodospira]|uniref:hypothetical protein n=1 Tax=Halorhodospira TaxID=85108 RepID=UPI001EE7CCF0|nr:MULTISPECIES: hypothetical protein [Halorhodospira]MCG5528599.1 hypothetical protein [Halorhodospira halophila]MCG5543738.1 hypothetical protein [Halorhodospira sp. 9628]
MTDQTAIHSYAAAIRRRLAKVQPDYHGIAQELHGAQCMALALGDGGAAAIISDLHAEVTAAWRADEQRGAA